MKSKTILTIILILVLGFFLVEQYTDNHDKDRTIERLIKNNEKHLETIAKRDSLLIINKNEIKRINQRYDSTIVSIDSMKISYNNIEDKHAKIYLNPDSVNWYKLDSLLTILLYRESRLREERLYVPGL